MKRRLSVAINWLRKHWRGIVCAIVIAILAILTLGFKFNNLVAGQNQFEVSTLANLKHFPKPWIRAVNAPYTMPAYLIGKSFHNSLYGARISSVILGLIATACFFFLLKIWFNARIATVGSVLFITSSWLLHLSHQATPFTMLVLAPLLILMTLAWYLRTKKHKSIAFYSFAAALGVAAYVPFMPWILVAMLVILVLREKEQLSVLKYKQITVAALIYFILLLPLFVSLLSHPGQLRELFGIPVVWPSFGLYFSQLYHTIIMMLIWSPAQSELHLGHLPLLDIFSSAMFLLGLYYYIRRFPKRRSVILLVCFGLLIMVLPLSASYQLNASVLIPFIYVCIIAGIVELLNQWFVYFPRNPLARNVGVVLVVIAIGFTSFYHLQNYYVAWPKSSQTKAAYMVKLE